MRRSAVVAILLLAGSACSSGAAPDSSNVLAQKHKASGVEVESTLRNAALAEQTYFTEAQTYTTDPAALQQVGFNGSDIEVRIARADASSFCIDTTAAGSPMHIGTPELTPLPGACS